MNQEDIIRMAREIGLPAAIYAHPGVKQLTQAVAAAEREACAKACEDKAMHCETKAQEAIEAGEHDEVSAIRSTAWQISVCAAAIRARGETSSRGQA